MGRKESNEETKLLYCIEQDEGKEKVNYKADHRFADLMQDKTEAVSDFAKKRTMFQQRQYLPIFAVRNEVGYSFLYRGA